MESKVISLEDFEKAARQGDANAFLGLVDDAKECMRESIDENALERLTAQHATLMNALGSLASAPELASNWGVQSEAFMLPLLPILPKNSVQAFRHLNCSPAMDAFLLKNKLDIASLTFSEGDSAYLVLTSKLIDLKKCEEYGELICHMLSHAQPLSQSSTERRRILSHVFSSLGKISEGMRLSAEHKRRIEALITHASTTSSRFNFDECAGYRQDNLPVVMVKAIEKSAFVHVGHFTKIPFTHYSEMIAFLAPHADEAVFAKTYYGFARQGDARFPELFAGPLFDSDHYDIRNFIDSYLEQSAHDYPLFLIANAKITLGVQSLESEFRVIEYLNILIGNGKYQNILDADKLSSKIGIPAEWILKTSWHQVHRLSLELGL